MSAAAEKRNLVTPAAFARLNRRRRALEAKLATVAGLPLDVVNLVMKRDVIALHTGGNDSSKALDARGWAAVFAELENRISAYEATATMGQNRSVPARKTYAGALSTAAQRSAIQQLAAKIKMEKADLENMCERRWKWRVAGTRWQASHLIEALKSMVVIELQLFERAARLPLEALTPAERGLAREFGHETKPNKLKIGAVLWMASICDAYEIPLVHREVPR